MAHLLTWPPPLPLAAQGSEKPPVPQGDPGIGFTASARSLAPALCLVVVVPVFTAGPRQFSLLLEAVLPPPFLDFGMYHKRLLCLLA